MNKHSIRFIGKEQLELVEERLREPGPGEMLVETTRSMISTGTESTVFTRNFSLGTHWDKWVKYPFYPGYLNAGHVAAVGAGVTGWKVGDRVASRSGHTSHHLVQAIFSGSSERPDAGDCTPGNVAVRIPAGVTDEDAAWMGLGKIVQVGIRAAKPELGESVVVIGLGLLGQLVVQYARLLGAAEVIAIDTSAIRLDMAQAHGATRILKMGAGEARDSVYELTGGRGADTVYDVTGHYAVLPLALPLARRFGQVILLGDPGSPERQTLTPDVITRGVRIIGAHDGHPPIAPQEHVRWSGQEMFELFLHYLARGDLRVSDLVTHRYKPSQAAEAYSMLQKERDRAMGVVFEWV